MDFIARINALKPKHYQPLWTQVSQLGNFQEIVSYINAMDVIADEDPARFLKVYGEVRMDARFIVFCQGSTIRVIPTGTVRYWYLCQKVESQYGLCEVGLMTYQGLQEFCVRKMYSKALFDRLCRFCPEFSAGSPTPEPSNLGRYADGRRFLRYVTPHLFSPDEVEQIPLDNILACSLICDSDGETDSYYLQVHLKDGTTRRTERNNAHECYKTARALKYYEPRICYRLDSI